MHPDHPVETVIDSILPYSRYAQRLLDSEPELRVELEKTFIALSLRPRCGNFWVRMR